MVQSNPVNTDAKGAIESVRGVRIKRVEFRENVWAYVPQGQGKLSVIMGDRIKRVSVKRDPSLIMTSCFSFSSTGGTLRATKQPHALFNSALLGSHG